VSRRLENGMSYVWILDKNVPFMPSRRSLCRSQPLRACEGL